METTSNSTISRVEAVIASMNEKFVELQIAGSYITFQWPRNLFQNNLVVGEKILIELKNHPCTSIQKTVEAAKQNQNDPIEQRKLLETLIN